jgi:hypothetical protein
MSKTFIAVNKKTGKGIGIDTLISWGATVVIAGLTFKLLHWQGGEWMIGIGLAVEAFLFFILGLQAMNNRTDTTVTNTVVAEAPANRELDELLHKTINPVTIQRLNEGFEQFNKTVESVNHIVSYNAVAKTMVDEVENATRELLALRTNLEEINKVYRAQIEAFKKN